MARTHTATDTTPFSLTKGSYMVISPAGCTFDVSYNGAAAVPISDPNGLLAENRFEYYCAGEQIIVNSGYPVTFTEFTPK